MQHSNLPAHDKDEREGLERLRHALADGMRGPLTRRDLIEAVGGVAVAATLAQPAFGSEVSDRGEPFDDGSYFDDGTGWID